MIDKIIAFNKAALALLIVSMALVACEQEGPGERLGEAADEIGDSVKDGAEDFGNAVEDACEEASGENC